MNLESFYQSLQSTLGDTLPGLLAAVGILIVGWFVAMLLRAGTRRGLKMARLNERIASSTDSEVNAESWGASGVFWIVMLLTLIAFFNVLDLEIVSAPLQALVTKVLEFGPSLFAAAILALLAWVLASLLRGLIGGALAKTTLDEKISEDAEMKPVSHSIGDVVYWLVILLFLPAILGTLKMEGLLVPVQGMVDKILAMLPNIFAAGLIGLVGWFVARILRDLVENLLGAVGFDGLGEKAGLTGNVSLSKLAGLLVFIFVFVPALIAALNTLQIEAISGPATDMLGAFMGAIPDIFAAIIILSVAVVLAKFISGLIASLLEGLGADSLPDKLGLTSVSDSKFALSKFVGQVVSFFIILFAAVEAASQLGFVQVSDIASTLIEFAGQVLLGGVILIAGFWLSNIAHATVLRVSGDDAAPLAGILRAAIIGLVLAMGLRAMGIADDIVNLAFGLVLGAVAVAFALSFGLGGREAAGKQMDYWLTNLRKEK
ncbi:MAG: mechanosensitive ion channel [Gammaproteobacteria bacterium]|nr:mechanosensitive ion channel [Gammaproteobacteria bacterium]MBT8104301.1 mechanosensitive ion channel [Gammaproteobacteria bacterium]NNF48363.1 mechanosensitive ion channel [Woeseiaceae bacterium]NNK24316.1 mechanosensitive ion channel [Woeseiaceae bacterium]